MTCAMSSSWFSCNCAGCCDDVLGRAVQHTSNLHVPRNSASAGAASQSQGVPAAAAASAVGNSAGGVANYGTSMGGGGATAAAAALGGAASNQWLPPALKTRPSGSTSKQGACAGEGLVKSVVQGLTSLADCRTECNSDPECVAIEYVSVKSSSKVSGKQIPHCTVLEVGSKITHVLPRPDGAECFLKPAYAAAGAGGFKLGMASASLCTRTQNCLCCHLVGPGADLSSSSSTPCENLQSADLRNYNLEGIKLENVDLTCAVLDGSNLKGADLTNAIGTGTSFIGALVEGAKFEQANLMGADFSKANLMGTNFHQSSLEYVKFERSNIAGATFIEANMLEASFVGALGAQTADFTLAAEVHTTKGLNLGLRSSPRFSSAAVPMHG
eukprot:CAMPEP_0119305356 /NCGR_PEP_ID=MMETSP1333-20130426/6368_1 /TAXON_ID=418940 /ORGANISM="Scyphosphaera apsteinii, Strain RCC1455" /LENGTH=384 /DNA_ID=CAMNT_0007308429 /DNA_START=318 /DNA_END=1472 /DNA_ORIENTATION=-